MARSDLLLRLERHSAVPLRDQLYHQLREAIVAGRLRRGDRLPPTRQLAAELSVARLTVVDVYDQLLAEGYAQARQGAGTFVAISLAEGGSPDGTATQTAPPRLSRWGKQLVDLVPGDEVTRTEPNRPRYDFRPGVGAWEQIAWARWRRLSAALWNEAGAGDLWYGEPFGPLALRRAIAGWVARGRAVRCTPDQIAITNGAQQAVSLLARLVVEPGDVVAVEDPGYKRAQLSFRVEGARLAPVPVDAEGLRVGSLPPDARIVHVTPSHQYPLGVTLPIERRLALLGWARERDALIVEDDYDGELHLEGHRLESLQGLDGGSRVAYVGTLSKALFPSLRLGFVVLPPGLVEPFRRLRFAHDRQPPWHEAAVLARFIEEGELERHVHRLRRLYRDRRDALFRAIDRVFGDRARVGPCETGGHVAVRLPPGVDDVALCAKAAERGVAVSPLSTYFLTAPRPGLVIGLGGVDARLIRPGIEILAELL
jgi:GntR family transcriptional regulator/MocR family aminotransferase